MEQETIIIISVFSAAWLAVFVMAATLCVLVGSLRRTVQEMQSGRIRVQKVKMGQDNNHAFQNPALSPDEELSRRGYSMYMPDADLESGRGTTERQTGGQFVEELTREIDHRQQRQSASPYQEQNKDRYSRDPNTRQDSRYADSRQNSRYADTRDSRYGDSRQDSRYADPRHYPDTKHRDVDPRQSDKRQLSAPPFLLQAIEENKRKSKLANPVANGNGRQSDTNPNFMY